ncbi:MAG: hypothetical protein M9894_23730 [Planctomycetes bacterium]|nr:hypothetical protein [Planctomycetota bacterium]
MGCLLALLGAFFPRVVLVLAYLLTSFVHRAVPSPALLWAALGFVFAPTSFLWFCAVQSWYGGQWGCFQILVMVFALSADFGAGGRGAYELRSRRGVAPAT